MCGICGIIDLKASRPVDRDAVGRMIEALRRRGPDGDGAHFAPGVGFGHTRLAIVDRAGGAQPFTTANEGGVLSFNGEIYNHDALRAELARQGSVFRTRSDTEVLAEGLNREGVRFIERTRGVFAFAHWNARNRRLLLARDRLGERPLYYAQTPDGFLVFASTIAAIVASGTIPLAFDNEALTDYFYYGFIPDPKSVYKGVKKLPAGATLEAASGAEPVIARYWRLTAEPAESMTFEDGSTELLRRLQDAVNAQSIADVPLGALLSGGVDSSAIVSLMATSGQQPNTFTVGFDDGSADERAYARRVARALGARHKEAVASLSDPTLIDEVAAAFGEPFADSSALPTYVASRLAREHVTVALTGDGGDELFSGYRRHAFVKREDDVRRLLPPSVRQPLFSASAAAYPKLDWAPRPLRLKTTLASLGKSRSAAYADAMAANLESRMSRILSPEFKAIVSDYDPSDIVSAAMPEDGDPLRAALFADLAVWLPGRMLVKSDRASMAHGLELRPPMLDHAFVEWAATLPSVFKFQHGVGKRIFKSAFEGRVPGADLSRPKQGFAMPLKALLRDPKGPIARLDISSHWKNSGILDASGVRRLAEHHRSGVADCSQELWTIIMFDAFLAATARGET